MPVIKEAHLRYRVIDRALNNQQRRYPSLETLRELCAEAVLGMSNAELISVSTVEKDLRTMRRDFGAPIRYSRSNGGYYYSDSEFTIEDAPLSAEEMESLRAAVNTLGHFRNIPLFAQFGSTIDKLMTKVAVEEKHASKKEEVILFEQAPSTAGVEHIPLLVQAIYDRKTVEFRHQKYTDSEDAFRRVDPYLLKEYRNRWYLIGYSHLAMDIRTFGLDRMMMLEVTSAEFTRREQFNADNYFRYSIGITASGGNPERILFRASGTLSKYLISQPVHQSQELVKTGDDHSVFSLHVLITSELLITLLGYGHSLRVLEPASLVEHMKGETNRMAALYA